MMSRHSDSCLRLRDGRLLGYTEAGKPDGLPVLYFHGVPGSRRELHPLSDIADEMGLRLFVLERPGYGLSNLHPERRLLDWPADVEEFADRLGLSAFSVIGFSGGGPYALACVYSIPQRISAAVIVSSPAPYVAMEILPENLALFELARDDPQQATAMLNAMAATGDKLYDLMTCSMPEAEKRIMSTPAMATMYHQDMVESVLQGVEGLVQDMGLIAANWDFNLEGVVRPVHLWHGIDDGLIPLTMGQYLADKLPDCQAMFLAGQGHYLLFPKWREILVRLISEQKKSGG